jgi:hypothetical protein
MVERATDSQKEDPTLHHKILTVLKNTIITLIDFLNSYLV